MDEWKGEEGSANWVQERTDESELIGRSEECVKEGAYFIGLTFKLVEAAAL